MLFTSVILLCLCLYPYSAVHAIDCVNVDTSEGVVTLHHGDRACAALQPGDSSSDLGKSFYTCNNGDLLTQICAGSLRFDTVTGGCNWPGQSTCALSNAITGGPGVTAIPHTQWPVQTISCDDTNCKLPACFCYGATPKMAQADMPMFVMLTFDDAVTAVLYNDFYRHLVTDNTLNLLNPNGCKIKITMYMTDINTEYAYVKILADEGNEIASHTLHHILAQGDKDSDYANISAEIVGVRDKVFEHLGDQALADSLVGFRAPYLRVAGNVMYDVLRDNQFLYDTSITNIEASQGRVPKWPYSLDIPVSSCLNPPCPTLAYPGVWEVPLNGWVGDDGFSCGMIDGCNVGGDLFTANETDWYDYYKRNFQDHFYPTKVPMHMFTHASMFERNYNSWLAMTRWLQDMLADHSDVWMVTPKMVIDWIKNPQTHASMVANKWGC